MCICTGYPPFLFPSTLPKSTRHSSPPALYSGRQNYVNYINGFPHSLASYRFQAMGKTPAEDQKAVKEKGQDIYFSDSLCGVTMAGYFLN